MTAGLAETDAHEGPVYVPDEDALYFTSRPSPDGPIKRLGPVGEVTVLRPDANLANGMALDPDGRLIVCEQGSRDEPAAHRARRPPHRRARDAGRPLARAAAELAQRRRRRGDGASGSPTRPTASCRASARRRGSPTRSTATTR